VIKARNLDVDELEGELIILNVRSQQIIMLNAAGLELWKGLDVVNTRSAAMGSIKEALPEVAPDTVEQSITKLIEDLLRGGFLKEVQG